MATRDIETTTPRFQAVITLCISAFCFFIILLSAMPAQAEIAAEQEMDQVCQNWLSYIVTQTGDWAGSRTPTILESRNIIDNDTLLARYYAISPNGYIIVPALRELSPVKSYSTENYLDLEARDGYVRLIREVIKSRMDIFVAVYGSLEASQSTAEPLFDLAQSREWDRFAVSPKAFAEATAKSLLDPMAEAGPLLTTTWHQGAPYNDLCPIGDGGRCVVGCVATAAAQIIYFHQWPPAGEGSHGYNWSGDNSCDGNTAGQYLSADFSDEYTYDGSAASVAEISYEMGVAFNMDYGVCGSGAYTLNGANVFPAYFRYDEAARAVYRDNYGQSTWFDMIKDQINKGRPMLYRIYSHAIVCDGWRVLGATSQYHFNYGWGGGNNSWYTVDNLYCPWDGCDPMVEGMVMDLIPLNGSPWLDGNEFDDVALGDGDGVPEGGETVELAVTIANYGGAEITDVSISLAIDDASLNLLNTTAWLGTIPPQGTMANTVSPFVIEIPPDYIPRVDSFIVEITWNGTDLDTLYFERAIGGSRILIVDDDDNNGLENYYAECLDNFRAPYDVWIHSFYATPDSAYLSQYDMVIWFTGDERAYPLSYEEIDAMTGFMNGGGNLFLTGQSIAAELDGIDPIFLNDYLKADYIGTSFKPLLVDGGGSLFESADTVVIFGGGADNQTAPDQLQPLNGGSAELQYLATSDYGAITYSGDYNLVFFGFGFEAVKSNDPRFTDRDSTMACVFRFLNYAKPMMAPLAGEITVGPGEKMHLIDHTPLMGWSYFDENAAPQEYYQVQVGDNDDWAVAEMWDSGPVASADAQTTYAGAELIDGHHYYIRARVFNGSLWSPWSYTDMILNSLPDAPNNCYPDYMHPVYEPPTQLSHNPQWDPQGDDVTYAYEIYDDAAMTTLVTSAVGQPQDPSRVYWTVDVALDEDHDYFWRARADDEYETGTWSDLSAFWINFDNQLPGAFNLLTPVDGTVLDELRPTLAWEAAVDPEPFDQVKYTLMYDTDPAFASAVTIPYIEATEYTLTQSLVEGNTYYWKVIAHDMLDGQTASGDVFELFTYLMGDANGDREINVGDAVFLINYAFKDGPAPNPPLAGDANCDEEVNVGDAVFIINYAFKDGPAPSCD